jgi:glycosyltransferase involved in cell wall biosynthesis
LNKVAYYIISDGIGGAEQVVWQTLRSFETNPDLYLILNNEIYDYYKNSLPENRILNIGDVYIHTKRRYRLFRYLLNNRYYNFRQIIVKSKMKRIAEFCTKNKIKVIHTHLDYALISVIQLKKNLPDIKLIHTVHGAFGLLNDNKLKPDVTIKKIDHQKIDLLIFVANYLADLYRSCNIPIGENCVIYNGLEPNSLFNTLPTERDKNTFKILYVGGSKHVKGYDILIETVEKLIEKKHTNFHVTVLGQLNTDCELIQLIQRNKLEMYFTLIGFVDPPNHLKYFKENNILFMPSRSEALPMAAIEAVFCNLPVIASNIGGISEVIISTKNGQLCEIKSEKFCDAIIQHVRHRSQLQPLYSSFNQNHKNNFDMQVIKKKLSEIYTNIHE